MDMDIISDNVTTATEQSAAEDTGQVSQDNEYTNMNINEYEVVA